MKKITLLLLLINSSLFFAQEQNESLKEVSVVGSRNSKRTVVNSAVPIDIINIKDVTTQSGKIEINELLQYVAPSFNANKQSGSDGSDHVDPASLRGMGPDQTLVLINGKRRHQSSLVNLFGTRGRGNTGTDLNSIPATSIKRIEILRDGAAAQYGSDAIAGVINIVLNDNVNELTGAVTYGMAYALADGDYLKGTANTNRNFLDQSGNSNTLTDRTNHLDGNALKIGANYGVKLGKNGGFANFTTEFVNKEKTLRPGYDFRKGFGEAAIISSNFMINMNLPLTKTIDFYAFGGRNYRDTDAYAFTRNGGERVVQSIYPGGYTPRITSNIVDNAITGGFRTQFGNGLKMDFSNTYGTNKFIYRIKNTLNATLEGNSPTEFDAGGFGLNQNTTNLDFTKNFKSVLNGLNIAFGAEYRIEQYKIFAGEEGSYETYDTSGNPIRNPLTQSAPTIPNPDYDPTQPITDENSVLLTRPSGSQGFPGFSPKNELSERRTNKSIYADAELDITDKFLVSLAGRAEQYSDFGNTFNVKLSSRYKLTNNANLRGSVSTGFRAPSLAQLYFNTNFTNFTSTGASEILLSQNESAVTKGFGIEKLKEERAKNASLGITAKSGNFTATIDGYFIRVDNRIVLTSTFDATALNLNVDEAQFFANGADTETKGIDVVMAWNKKSGVSRYGITLVGNINDMKIVSVKNGVLEEERFFGKREKAFFLASAPKSKFGLNLNYGHKWLDAAMTFTRFDKIVLVDYALEDDYYGAKIVSDATLGFQLSKELKLNIGANNIFNVYPDKQDEQGNTEAGGYYDAVQMGFGGTYFYARMGFKF